MALMDGPALDAALRAFYGALAPGGALAIAVLHPCFFTPSLGWWRGAEDDVPRLQVSHYFDRSPRVQRWSFPGTTETFSVPRFPRTLSEYIGALRDAGFTLDAVREPRPSEAVCRRHPTLRAWREHAALFLHLRALKPGRTRGGRSGRRGAGGSRA
jgi:hypothetical protein